MELEQQHQHTLVRPAGGPPPDDTLESTMAESQALLAAADQMLDSIRVVDYEGYLSDNRQEGGQ